MKKLFIFSPKTINPFSKFFKALTVPWCSTPFSTKDLFWMILTKPIGASALWWPCWKSVLGWWRPEWNLKFSRPIQVLDVVLKCSSDINKGKSIHHSLTALHCWIILHRYLSLVFFICESGVRQKISRFALLTELSQLDFTTDLTTNGLLFVFFCLNMARFVVFIPALTENCKTCSKFTRSWRHQKFSMISLWGNFNCFFNVPVFLTQWFYQNRMLTLINAIQFYFLFCA